MRKNSQIRGPKRRNFLSLNNVLRNTCYSFAAKRYSSLPASHLRRKFAQLLASFKAIAGGVNHGCLPPRYGLLSDQKSGRSLRSIS